MGSLIPVCFVLSLGLLSLCRSLFPAASGGLFWRGLLLHQEDCGVLWNFMGDGLIAIMKLFEAIAGHQIGQRVDIPSTLAQVPELIAGEDFTQLFGMGDTCCRTFLVGVELAVCGFRELPQSPQIRPGKTTWGGVEVGQANQRCVYRIDDMDERSVARIIDSADLDRPGRLDALTLVALGTLEPQQEVGGNVHIMEPLAVEKYAFSAQRAFPVTADQLIQNSFIMYDRASPLDQPSGPFVGRRQRNGSLIFPYRAPAKTNWGANWRMFRERGKPKYDGIALRKTIEALAGKETILGEAKTRVLVPAINVTAGKVQMFKTPHDPRLTEDQWVKVVDIGMATSAAPLYFPLAKIKTSYFADGGLAANSPDICAVHEAVHYAAQDLKDVRVLSIGTTSSAFGIPASVGANLGAAAWLEKSRLVNVTFGVQQNLVASMMAHDLGDRYLRIDEVPSGEHLVDLELDLATPGSTETLKALADAAYRRFSAHPLLTEFVNHSPPPMDFMPKGTAVDIA